MPELYTKRKLKLTAISKLLDALEENNILYCHWKSNEHLAVSMAGDTDLDVLFDEKQKEKIESILNTLGFKQFNAIRQKQYKDIVDFLYLDTQSGKIIHLHTHYRLTMGEPYLKGYQLDLESVILNTRVHNEQFGIYCTAPALELVLLYLRESLKFRNRDLLLMYLRNKKEYSEFMLREYDWLKANTNDAEIADVLMNIFGSDYVPIYELVTGEFNRKQLRKLAPIIKAKFSAKRLYSPFSALVRRWYRECTVVGSRKLARLLALPILSKRINPRGGIVVAVIGADGSGKSTVTANLMATFSTKLDVYKIYFGRGDGKVSWSRKLLFSFKKVAEPNRKSNGKTADKNTGKKKGFVKSLYKCLEAILVAREKNNNLRQMKKAKQKGVLVICDRYPQNQVMGFNDGPLLYHFRKNRNFLFRAFARIEGGVYEKAERTPPDILIKLIADAAIVEKRKPGETSIEKLEDKINGIRSLRMKDSCKVVTVDATMPLSEVLSTVKHEIWQIL